MEKKNSECMVTVMVDQDSSTVFFLSLAFVTSAYNNTHE